MLRPTLALALLVSLACSATAALAAVTISPGATQNMSCSGGICAPTSTKAVLNAGDLQTLLASGNVAVLTTGQGVQAKDIEVKASVTWSNGSVLTLDAFKSITINQPVSIAGLAGLALDTNDGGGNGALSFGPKGNVTFANLASSLTINGSAYMLVSDLKTLASDIASNPNGDFALAGSYNASGDGTYNGFVVSTEYYGTFTGLGNTISNLSIVGGKERDVGNGLFAGVGNTGVLENIGIVNANIVAKEAVKYVFAGPLAGTSVGTIAFAYATGSVKIGKESAGGGLVGANAGTITNSYAKTAVVGSLTEIGGLVGLNEATIANCHAAGSLSAHGVSTIAGGLVGQNEGGTIETSYATGAIKGGDVSVDAEAPFLGGLVGYNNGAVSSSYASGAVSGGNYSRVGGLVALNYSTISASYSTGAVKGGATGSIVGGLIGYDSSSAGSLTDAYWDTDTSGIANLSQGAGNIANDPGITGLTTAQFQSGLPAGFDPKIWAEKTNIIDGLPYLLANPPPK
jgi:hypothetical protein